MRHSLANTTAATLLTDPADANLPRYVDRQRAAELVTHFYFRVSPRSLERWPLIGKVLNGRLTFPTADVLRIARERMDAAPAVKGGPVMVPHKRVLTGTASLRSK